MKYSGNRCPVGWEVELRFHCGIEFLDGCFESFWTVASRVMDGCFESYERVEIVLRSLKKQVDGRIEIVLCGKGPF